MKKKRRKKKVEEERRGREKRKERIVLVLRQLLDFFCAVQFHSGKYPISKVKVHF